MIQLGRDKTKHSDVIGLVKARRLVLTIRFCDEGMAEHVEMHCFTLSVLL